MLQSALPVCFRAFIPLLCPSISEASKRPQKASPSSSVKLHL